MKKIVLLLMLLLIGCKAYTFEEGFNKVILMDSSYNASFYKEALDVENNFHVAKLTEPDWDKHIVSIENAEAMLNELDEFRKELNEMRSTEDMEALKVFVDARKDMLLSEKLYKEWEAYGSKSSVRYGFKCGDRAAVIEASDILNESIRTAYKAVRTLDALLGNYSDAIDYYGNDKRPKFYTSPLSLLSKEPGRNKRIIKKFCNDTE